MTCLPWLRGKLGHQDISLIEISLQQKRGTTCTRSSQRVCYELIDRELQILLKLFFPEDVSTGLVQTSAQASAPFPKPSVLGAGARPPGLRGAAWVMGTAGSWKCCHPPLQLEHGHPRSMGDERTSQCPRRLCLFICVLAICRITMGCILQDLQIVPTYEINRSLKYLN